jgi:hypothetical protein
VISASVLSQSIQYECKVKYTSANPEITADITVTVKSGEADFTYYLMTNDPIHGAILMKSVPTGKKNYTFEGVKPGKYFIKIIDNEGNQAGKTVNVDKTEN